MIFLVIVLSVCCFIGFGINLYMLCDIFKKTKHKSCKYKFIANFSVKEETETAREVFETLEKAGIEVNFLGSKDKNNEPKEL